MKAYTYIKDSKTGDTIFQMDFLYDTTVGNSIHLVIPQGEETFNQIFEIVDIDVDYVNLYRGSIERHIKVFNNNF